MANEGFIARLVNLWKGMFAGWIGRREEQNPEAVYEAAIHERLEQYEKLKKAVAGIIYLRNKLASELEQKTKDLGALQDQIMLAVDKDDDEVALVLIQRKDELETDLARIREELEQTSEEAEQAKKSMVDFQGEIDRLRREKERALAQLATLEARRAITRQLDRLSPEADVRALESVRERVEKLSAEMEATKEIQDRTLNDKLKQIRRESSMNAAKAQLEELKKAKQEQKAPPKVEKTI